jgi:hypothetical protein
MDKQEEQTESEFGKGLVICLVKFAEHRWRWYEQKRSYEEMSIKNPELFSESDAVELHFNGASDHLYEIEVPKAWEDTSIGIKVKELQDFGLQIGHGFTHRNWTESDVNKAYELCQEIALLIDEKLGLKPLKGSW